MLDTNDIDESLYKKLEYPTFIVVLTTNGRRFVEYLRRTGLPRVHDNQFMSLSVRPHVQIEVYSGFQMVAGDPYFGPYTDILAISFNAYLDYYHLEHWHRASPQSTPVELASQNIHYHALREYIANRFGKVPKDNLLFRYLDIPLSPLICWLEAWNEVSRAIPTKDLRGKTSSESSGLHDEFLATFTAGGVATIREPSEQLIPLRQLFNGEELPEKRADD